MILRLQSEQELELLQSRIKSRSKDIKVYENELRTNTGTDPEIAHLASLVPSLTRFEAPEHIRNEIKAYNASRKPQKHAVKMRNWSLTLQNQCKALKLPIPALEYRFHPSRLWRFDCAWVESRVAVEIEGGLWVNGRHNRAAGFLADMMKYNEATKLGWRVYRFSPSQVKKGTAVHFLGKVGL